MESDCLIGTSPTTESLDDPPLILSFQPRDYRHTFAALSDLVDPFGSQPRAGYFWVFATAAEGRFKGAFSAQMALPEPGDDLPVIELYRNPERS